MAQVIQLFRKEHKVAFINISRTAVTEPGEHAAIQIISVELEAPDAELLLKNVKEVNQALPQDGSIRVFDIKLAGEDFSARRSCDTRTFEYYIPVSLTEGFRVRS